MGWQYMLVDWQWYGKFNTPEAISKVGASDRYAGDYFYAKTKM